MTQNLVLSVPKEIRPSGSPDLNVCDNWLFSMIEGQSYAGFHSNVDSHKTVNRRALLHMTSEVIEANGVHIE